VNLHVMMDIKGTVSIISSEPGRNDDLSIIHQVSMFIISKTDFFSIVVSPLN